MDEQKQNVKPETLRLKTSKVTRGDLLYARAILDHFQLERVDYIIAGDGSATVWAKAAGFGSFLYDIRERTRTKFFGGFSRGTNNVAEIMAVLHPLLYLDAEVDTRNQAPVVLIVSDSEYVVNSGNKAAKRKSNQGLWSAMDDIGSRFVLIFRHSHRMVLPANVFGDTVGNLVRTTLEGLPR